MRAVVVTTVGGTRGPGAGDRARSRSAGCRCLVQVLACGVCSHGVAARRGTLKRGIELPVICGHGSRGRDRRGPARRVRPPAGGGGGLTQRRRVCGSCRWCRGRETLCPSLGFLGTSASTVATPSSSSSRRDKLVPSRRTWARGGPSSRARWAVGSTPSRDVARGRAGETVLVTGAGGGLGVHGIQVRRGLRRWCAATTATPRQGRPAGEAGCGGPPGRPGRRLRPGSSTTQRPRRRRRDRQRRRAGLA